MKTENNPGIWSGIVGSSSNYADNVVLRSSRGHGFAAEKANHMADLFGGKDAQLVGADNRRNGPDRLVGTTQIQSKYCRTGGACIAECFHEDRFRYMTHDGPMRIEVPSDQYEDAVRAMEHRIRGGQVPGVSNPGRAKEIVRRGTFSYDQVRNIARFGSIEGLTYDAANGIRLAGTSMGISFVVTFATSVWSGREFNTSLRSAVRPTLEVGAAAWSTSVLTAQVGRTPIEMKLRPATDWVAKKVGPKMCSWMTNGVRSGRSLHGASATNHLSKLMRGHAVAAGVTTVVLSGPDLARLFRRRISCGQMVKNVAVRGGGVVGGTGGWFVGAAIGASAGTVVPIIGTGVGGVVGGLAGSMGGTTVASKATRAVLDRLIEDDAKKMLRIVEAAFAALASVHLLSEREAQNVVEKLKHQRDARSKLQGMFAAQDRRGYATRWLRPLVEDEVKGREKVRVQSVHSIMGAMEETELN